VRGFGGLGICSLTGGAALVACFLWDAPTVAVVICALAATVMVWLPRRSWNRVIATVCLVAVIVIAIQFCQAYTTTYGAAWSFDLPSSYLMLWVDPHVSDLSFRWVVSVPQGSRTVRKIAESSVPTWFPIVILLLHPVVFAVVTLCRRRPRGGRNFNRRMAENQPPDG
jgi:hypothetical protein